MYTGSKVFLGPLLPDDATAIFHWVNDPAIAHANGPYRPVDWASHSNWFANAGKEPGKVVLAIRAVTDQRLVGYIQIGGIHPVFRSADLGIVIGDEADRGRGLGAEALGLAVKFCWNELNLNRISLFIFGANQRAIAAYGKAGFKTEGVLRQAAYVDGAFVDVTIMALLRAG